MKYALRHRPMQDLLTSEQESSSESEEEEDSEGQEQSKDTRAFVARRREQRVCPGVPFLHRSCCVSVLKLRSE